MHALEMNYNSNLHLNDYGLLFLEGAQITDFLLLTQQLFASVVITTQNNQQIIMSLNNAALQLLL
jgi:hypothetical protein